MDAEKIEDEAAREKFMRFACKYGSLRFRETMIKDARSLLAVKQGDFDRNAYLLNVLNGTIDLKTFELRPHSAEDMLTKLAPVTYSPHADMSRWLKFINDVFEEDIAKASYIQRMIGYCLTGGTELECLFFLYGPTTRNGKSTFLETVSRMLGDYAANAQPEAIAVNKNRNGGAATPELARLVGARLVSLPEPPRRMLLDVGLVKQMTGGDILTARNLHQAPFEFRPAFKLMVNTNSLPVVTDDTLFASNRVRIIEFTHHFTPEEQNLNLKAELTTPENLSGVLLWALQGLQDYQISGERAPGCVLTATELYKEASDKINRFFAECMQQSDRNTSGLAVFFAYAEWCKASGFAADSRSVFYDVLRKRGLMQKTGTVNGKTEKKAVCGYVIITE